MQAFSSCSERGLFFVVVHELIVVVSRLRRASLIAQLVKNLPAVQETLVQFLGWEDLEKGYAAHSSILGLPSWLSW